MPDENQFMQRPPTLSLRTRLIVDTEFTLTCPGEREQLAKNLTDIPQRALDNGLFTRETEALVNHLHVNVVDPDEDQVVTCVYCGHEYPKGTPTAKAAALTDHIKVCDKHPMREKEALIAKCLAKIHEETDGVLATDHDLFQAVCVLISQRDNAYNEARVTREWLTKAKLCDTDALKLVKVHYGDDTGLVSLTAGRLLASAEAEDIHTPEGIPSTTIADWQAEELFGEDHNWNDLIEFMQRNYDWKTKYLQLPE